MSMLASRRGSWSSQHSRGSTSVRLPLTRPKGLNGLDAFDDLACGLDLVLIHCVSHSGVEADRHIRAHPFEDVSRLQNAFLPDVSVDVAASEKGGSAIKATGVISRSPIGSNEAAAESDHAAVSAG